MKQDFDPSLLIEAIFEQSIADYIKAYEFKRIWKSEENIINHKITEEQLNRFLKAHGCSKAVRNSSFEQKLKVYRDKILSEWRFHEKQISSVNKFAKSEWYDIICNIPREKFTKRLIGIQKGGIVC